MEPNLKILRDNAKTFDQLWMERAKLMFKAGNLALDVRNEFNKQLFIKVSDLEKLEEKLLKMKNNPEVYAMMSLGDLLEEVLGDK